MKISKNLFNPLFWHIQDALRNQEIRYIYLVGGSSSGKSYSVSQALIIDALENGNKNLLMRKYSVDIDDTIYTDSKTIGSLFNKKLDNFRFIKHQIDAGNGTLKFKGLDKSERIKGISKFVKAYMDEVTEFKPEDLAQLKKRLRGQPNQQIIASWNPIHPGHWIKKTMDLENWKALPTELPGNKFSKLHTCSDNVNENSFKKINEKGNTLLIKTTYRDNYWIVGNPFNDWLGYVDSHVLEDFQHDKEHNQTNYQIYANGEYGVETEGLFFVHGKHYEIVSEIPENAKKLPVGLDFGYDPDPTACGEVFKLDNDIYLKEVFEENELTNISSNEDSENTIDKHLESHNISKKEIIICDNAEKKSIMELREKDWLAMPCRKGADSIMFGIKKMQGYNLKVLATSKNLISELQEYRKLKDPYTNTYLSQPDPKCRNKHFIDLFRYVISAEGLYW